MKKWILLGCLILFSILIGKVIYASVNQFVVNKALLKERDKINCMVRFVIPYLKSNDSLSRSLACQFLSSFALRAPIDSAVPVLKSISLTDTQITIISQYHGKPTKNYDGKHSNSDDDVSKNERSVSFPIRNAALNALAINNTRKSFDSLILAQSGTFNKRITYIYIQLFPQEYTAFKNPFLLDPSLGKKIAEYEFNKISWQNRLKELKKQSIHSELELISIIQNIGRNNYELTSQILSNNLSCVDLQHALSVNNGFSSWFTNLKSKKVTEFAIKRIKSDMLVRHSKYPSFFEGEVNYLVQQKNKIILKYLVKMLDDTVKINSPSLEMQSQRQSARETFIKSEPKLEYANKRYAYIYLAMYFGFPSVYSIKATDICVNIFKDLWVNCLNEK